MKLSPPHCVSPSLELRFELTDDTIDIFAQNCGIFVGIDEVFVARDRAIKDVQKKNAVIHEKEA